MNPSYSNLAFGADAGGRPQQPVFGTGGVQAPVSSGAGDVVLTPEKKSHKGIIAAIVLAVLIIGGVFAAMFLMRSGGANVSVSNDTRLAFNRYANYLLYGEDSDSELDEKNSDNTEDYIANNLVVNNISNNNENGIVTSEFFSKAEQLWDDFYRSLNNKDLTQLENVLGTYKENFEFTKLFMTNTTLNGEEFVIKFVTMDEANLDRWIEKYFAGFMNSNYESIKKYGENGVRYYDLYADYLGQAKSVGCLDENGKFVLPCEGLNTLRMSDEMIEIGDQMEEYQNKAISATFDDCWEIERILYGKDKQTERVDDTEGEK